MIFFEEGSNNTEKIKHRSLHKYIQKNNDTSRMPNSGDARSVLSKSNELTSFNEFFLFSFLKNFNALF